MAIECSISIPVPGGADHQAHTFDALPRIGEVIVLPQRDSSEPLTFRVVDVLHYPHAWAGSSERARLMVEPID